MINKTRFISLCTSILARYVPNNTVDATIHVMTNEKLNKLKNSDSLPDATARICLEAIYHRVALLKGNATATAFALEFMKKMGGNK